VRLWRVEDWACVATVREPFTEGFVSNTFSLRPSWSPEGQHLAVVNSFQSPCHTAPALERHRSWAFDFSYVGHAGKHECRAAHVHLQQSDAASGICAAVAMTFNACSMIGIGQRSAMSLGLLHCALYCTGAIVKTCYNPLIFRAGTGEDAATCVALGSQDTKLTVWLSYSKRPVVVGSKLFRQSVVDAAWTPDGYCLLACSTDGTVAVLQFEQKELGVPLDQVRSCNQPASSPSAVCFYSHVLNKTSLSLKAAVDQLLEDLYGTSKAGKTVFAESAAQLQLEAAAANGNGASTSAAAINGGGAAAARPAPGPVQPLGLAARLQPAGGLAVPFARPQLQTASANGQHRPRAADAPRRITAQPVAQPSSIAAAPSELTASAAMLPPAGRQQGAAAQAEDTGSVGAERRAAVAEELGPTPSKRVMPQRADARMPSHRHTAAAASMPESPARPAIRSWLALPDPVGRLSVQLLRDDGSEAEGQPGTVGTTLEATNDLAASPSKAAGQIACSCSGRQLWTDRVRGCIVQLAGNQHFSAVGLLDGTLLVRTPPQLFAEEARCALIWKFGWSNKHAPELGLPVSL
jgi:protein HIRA/HIR1